MQTTVYLSAAPCVSVMCRVANLAQEMFPEERSQGVTFQLGPSVWGQRLERLRVSSLAQLMVGPFNPVAPKLWQEDKRKGALSPQHLFQ